MLTSLASRLPGVYFETVPFAAAGELPRMDVAAFVGFAASGPLHTPVAIEGIGPFREIFGEPLALAWDAERGVASAASLGPCVEAFFRQGGRRCWIVRVADERAAVTLQFVLPGVFTADRGRPGAVDARSAGAWSSSLAAGTVLGRERFPIAPAGSTLDFDSSRQQWRVRLAQSPRTIRRGDLLEIVLAERVLFAFAGDVRVVDAALQVYAEFAYWFEAPSDSPATGAERFGADNPHLVPLDALATGELEAGAVSPSPTPDAVHRLTLDLLAWRGTRLELRLEGLGFSKHHPRFWADLPNDLSLFQSGVGRLQPTLSPEASRLRAEAATPRFPFAGPAAPADHYVPIGVSTRPDPALAGFATNIGGRPALELDGLTRFDDSLFLDPALARYGSGAVLGEAEHKYAASITPGEPALRGIHSLLPIAEVSSVAVPDASQRGWTREPPAIRPLLDAPHLERPVVKDGRVVNLAWTRVPAARRYRLQVDTCRNFSHPIELDVSPGAATAEYQTPDPCPTVFHFRVRAERRGEISAWSNHRAITVPPTQFDGCGRVAPGFGDLVLSRWPPESPQGVSGIAWEFERPDDEEPDDTFEVQRSFAPNFDTREYIGTAEDLARRMLYPTDHGDGPTYYRVRAIRRGVRGSWSNTASLEPNQRIAFTLLPAAEYEAGPLIAVQRALIRFCAARADIVALLSAPAAYRTEEVLSHLGDLLPQIDPRRAPGASSVVGALRVPALTTGEEDALSFAALYHPWIAVPQSQSSARTTAAEDVIWTPPDGYAAGLIAARSLRLGAWIAPANEPLVSVVALRPALTIDAWSALTEAQVNLIVAEARGFVILNAETLSRRDDLRPLNVRRLLILLRRLALREGATFVFEPNSDDFRALVRQRFDRVLSGMYLRGAFAGATPASGYRVVVDESVNPRRTIELGRFVVELRVAPSQPFRYLTVRLEQTAPERLQVTEA